MKKFFVILLLISMSLLVAEDWKVSGNMGLDLNQNYYSDSWDGGEAGSVTWVANIDMSAEKQFSPKFLNKNTLKLEFGQTHSQDKETKDWGKPQKTTDNIDFQSLGIFTLNAFVDPFVGFKFDSQFIDESIPDEKKTINPITLTESFGASKHFIKEDTQELSSRLGGAFKQNMNAHEGIDNTNNGGVEFVTDYKLIFSDKKADFSSSLNLYKALYYSESDALEGTEMEDYWKAVDVDWQNTLTFSLTSFFNIKFHTQLLYDKEIDVRGRFKQSAALGLTYKFF